MADLRNVCIVIGSRANYARIKSVVAAVHRHPGLRLQLVVGASALLHRFGEVIRQIEADGYSVTARVYSVVEGENPTTMAKSTGMAILELATLFENLKPDIVVTVADRFETMATAIAASYMNIPLAHTQGGEVTGSIDESVRHAITKLAHLHFPASEKAKERILRMGEDPSTVFLTGCPSLDLLIDIDLSLPEDIFTRPEYRGVGNLTAADAPYLVVVQHPVTTEYGRGLEQVRTTLEAVTRMGMQAVWLWPNVDAGSDEIAKGLRIFREKGKDSIQFVINYSPEDYARLINSCACLVGNSSSGIREGAFLGVPAVNVGTRQQGRERGLNVVDADYSTEAILSAIERQIEHGRYESNPLYGDGRAGERIAQVLESAELVIQKKMTY